MKFSKSSRAISALNDDAFKAQFIAVGVDHSEGVLCHLKPVAAKL